MNLSLRTIIISGAILFAGCSGNNIKKDKDIIYKSPEFRVSANADFQIIEEDILLPGMVNDMDVYKDHIVFLSPMEKQFFHLFDKHSGEEEGSMIHQGRGPKELIKAFEFGLDKETGEVKVFDFDRKHLLAFQIDSILAGSTKIDVIADNSISSAQSVFPGKTGWVAGLFLKSADNTHKRFEWTKDGKTSQYSEYPFDPDFAKKIYGQLKITVSPNEKHMAVGSLFGAVLEYFDLSDSISLKDVFYFSEPFQDPDTKRIDYEKSGIGFGDLYSTDKALYGAYGGNNSDMNHNQIVVFDWSGTPLMLLQADRNILKICVDENENRLYALLANSDGSFSLAYLDLNDYTLPEK